MNAEKLTKLLKLLDRLMTCAGQPDDNFVHMVLTKKGKILSPNGKVATIKQYKWSGVKY